MTYKELLENTYSLGLSKKVQQKFNTTQENGVDNLYDVNLDNCLDEIKRDLGVIFRDDQRRWEVKNGKVRDLSGNLKDLEKHKKYYIKSDAWNLGKGNYLYIGLVARDIEEAKNLVLDRCYDRVLVPGIDNEDVSLKQTRIADFLKNSEDCFFWILLKSNGEPVFGDLDSTGSIEEYSEKEQIPLESMEHLIFYDTIMQNQIAFLYKLTASNLFTTLRMAVNALDRKVNRIKNDGFMLDESDLGLNKNVQKKFGDKDPVENVSWISFEDKEVERICHEHGVYTFEDAAGVTTIIDETQWFMPSWFYDHKIKTFNEFKYFTGLKKVERHAFNFNTTLETITLPSSIESIGFGAFKDCSNLVKVTIQEGLKTIETCAFVNCRHLKRLVFPEGLERIESLIIEGCFDIESINVPDSVNYIAPTAFNECGESLNTIYISGNHHLRSTLSKTYPHVVLVDPKEVNESNLGLNKKVQNKFNDINAIDNISEYVDLGLPSGNLWAKCNVGSDEIQDYGDYMSYNEAVERGLGDSMPTEEDWEELKDNCNFCYTEYYAGEGYGMLLSSKKDKSKEIFLPAGGHQYETAKKVFGEGVSGNYLINGMKGHIKYFGVSSSSISTIIYDDRNVKCLVRLVIKKKD